jgi:hypothetical protein
MDYQVFTNDILTIMYESISGGLAADDAQKSQVRRLGPADALAAQRAIRSHADGDWLVL